MRAIIGVLWLGAALAGCADEPRGWKVEKVVEGSAFHGVHGIRVSPAGELYAGSVAGQTLYAVDPQTGAIRVVVGPPRGMADDIAFGPGGQVVWTAISDGVVWSRTGEGPVEKIADIVSVNAIAFSRDGKRLFASQVFGGDDLFELDPTGRKPPRLIRAKMGGFNSFWPGPDGKLYGPLWFKGQVVKVDPDTGSVEVVATGLKTPASVKFDANDNLYVIDTATGELIRIDPKTGAKTTVATLAKALDNFAIDRNGRAYVTNMADNAIHEVDLASGKVRQVVKGLLAFPADIAADGETLHIADVFAYRAADAKTGQVRELSRVHAEGSRLEYPTGVGVGRDRVLLASSVAGAVMAYDKKTGAHQGAWHGFAAPSDVVELADGSLVVSEQASGKLIRVRGEAKSTLAEGLSAPASLALGADGAIFVAEVGAGRVSRVDPATGARSTVAEGLKLPKAVAVREGAVLVLEVGARQVVSIDPKTGDRTTLAADLPVGLVTQPVPLAGGLAVAGSSVYLSSDVENAIYRLTPR
jgi:sugar lactone lactonase YvrE